MLASVAGSHASRSAPSCSGYEIILSITPELPVPVLLARQNTRKPVFESLLLAFKRWFPSDFKPVQPRENPRVVETGLHGSKQWRSKQWREAPSRSGAGRAGESQGGFASRSELPAPERQCK